jgi:coenzyme PQQ precursor peptide PqqA
MTISGAYAFYKEIRLEIIMARSHTPIAESGGPINSGSQSLGPYRPLLGLKARERRNNMREWHKPTIEETESGMEVTSYLPAELDRA